MTQIAFIFPGQGSQQVGMGAELAREYPIARAVFDEADAAVGATAPSRQAVGASSQSRQLSTLCFQGPAETLKQTENTQLAILTCSIATLRVLNHLGVVPKAVAGHSLGEYSALVAAGTLDFPDALTLVRARAQAMAAAGEQQQGTMAAILGMEAKRLQQLCQEAEGVVNIANYNCPGQLVISGEVNAVNRVVALASAEIGARRCRPLQVSGAFHSPLMAPAQQKFKTVLKGITLHPPKRDVAMNVTGEVASDAAEMRRLLFQQITAPVQWEKSLQTLAAAGISHFVEVGPGKVLCGLVSRTLRGSVAVNVEDVKSLADALQKIQE